MSLKIFTHFTTWNKKIYNSYKYIFFNFFYFFNKIISELVSDIKTGTTINYKLLQLYNLLNCFIVVMTICLAALFQNLQ